MDYSMNGRVQTRAGNRDHLMAPHNCYRCRGDNNWVTIAVACDEEWHSLRGLVGDSRLEDERFADAASRRQNQEALDQLIGEWTSRRSQEEVTQTLQKAGVAAMPVLDGPALVQDPQLRARAVLQSLDHPAIGERLTMGPAWRFSRTPAQISRPGPLLGEHNRYVLGGLLGMSGEEIERLVAEEVVY
jgi:benzylsuccinate CoA-transferase BbsF subunit